MTAPSFIDRDPQQVVEDLVAQYEAMTGRTLYPAQIERLIIDLVAYRESLTRELIQDTALQNLVAFARAPFLDHLGALLGVDRLPAGKAHATVRMEFTAATARALPLPAGWRVELPSGQVFAADSAGEIPAGALAYEFAASAQDAGVQTNGWPPSLLRAVDDAPAALAALRTTTTTRGGMDAETDERYRQRVKLAPEAFSYGSEHRYRLTALSVAPSLRDVRVWSPRPDGSINVVLLGADGVPGPETVAQVQAALDAPRGRMLGDRITVSAAVPVDYAISVRVDVAAGYVSDLVLAGVEQRLRAWAAQQAGRLGGDLVPAQIVAAGGGVAGVYDLQVLAPAQRVLQAHEWPRLTGVSVVLGKQLTDG
ncbi:baseplate J/gp47 family protein [Acidovorax sp. GBBC 3332]|nr:MULTISPECIES: baseplate J/gp47 family protein [unclassified Acidovorax]MDA8449847.1 baseplate J/gp47 family protein [Acidovorax sp. GBBC 3297]MDA8459292.1 baseplate J/gp47 family protein [Acidovorax sp. GBBC 3333]MDA8464329.1 baseplate J/gp47 family protein [Acidovorax sp. GBBC 3332]MDA8469460.1 baseplate J/gp47 family protein [Acidovorax sp. GBBC 3299]